jgi:hypothetical protein
MNINDIWNGILSIYTRITPAAILILAFGTAIWFSSPKLSFKSIISSRLEKAANSENLKNLERVLSLSHLSSLIPLLVIILFLVVFIIIGDLSAWFGNFLPVPFAASYTPRDIFSEQRSPDDLAILAVHLINTKMLNDIEYPEGAAYYPTLRDIYDHYAREYDRLRIKYPERYQNSSRGASILKDRTLYGGFFALTLFFLSQLIFRKKNSKLLWFRYTTFSKTLLVLFFLILLTCTYRLKWEWSTEREISSDIRITTGILSEEGNIEAGVSDELISWIEQEQDQYEPRGKWLARNYDFITMRLRHVSYRQLN